MACRLYLYGNNACTFIAWSMASVNEHSKVIGKIVQNRPNLTVPLVCPIDLLVILSVMSFRTSSAHYVSITNSKSSGNSDFDLHKK